MIGIAECTKAGLRVDHLGCFMGAVRNGPQYI
jgi:hypothetical protein